MGHKQGVDSVKNSVKACIKFGVKYLTLYAFSTENWLRPRKEIKGLFKLLENFLDSQFQIFHKNNVRLCIIGDREKIAPFLRKKIEQVEKDTKAYNSLVLNIALSYGAREEIVRAVKNISEDVRKGNVKTPDIDEKLFSEYLYTKDCPDPDLLIRTSGEMRISNFLLWQISYAEFYVTPKLWPDFGEKDLKIAIEEYDKRDRRYGK